MTRPTLSRCALKFSLNSHQGVSEAFHQAFYMSVKDVSDAFPLVPLHPSLWRFMLLCWWFVGAEDNPMPRVPSLWCIYCHIFAGFGMAGIPGVWTILFTHCLMGMARSEEVVDLPVVIHRRR